MNSNNIYTPFCVALSPFLGCDARITPLKTRQILIKIEHIYY